MKQIIIINGLPQCGKDTFVKMCSKYAKVQNFSSIGFIKDVATYAGWNGIKDDKGRWLLSELKQTLTLYDDIPNKKVIEKIKEFKNSNDEILFIHIREADEIRKVCNAYKEAQTLIVKRPSFVSMVSNDSDRYVSEYTYDFLLNNDSTLESMELKAKAFVKYILN